jgi:hypothetical protein
VYRLVGRTVGFASPKRRMHHVKGVVLDVSRDIFEDTIELELEDGRKYRFKEPAAVLKDGADVVLAYGSMAGEETDKETFKGLKEKGYAESMEENLRRTARARRKDVRICVLEDEPGRRRRRRR